MNILQWVKNMVIKKKKIIYQYKISDHSQSNIMIYN
jgi:hypothetical protein